MKHQVVTLVVLASASMVLFQNCSKVTFGSTVDQSKNVATGVVDPVDPGSPIGSLPVCEGVSCTLTPLTSKAAVTTILIALGDEVDNQLVVKQASAQFVAESAIRYTSPVSNPKILLVHDFDSGSESPEDYSFAHDVLLARYNVTEMNEPSAGLAASDLVGYDLVWLNNPGRPMNSSVTRDVLIAFKGGVVLQGDDMSWGTNFDNSSLTGLKFIDNGTQVVCDDGKTYNSDNNAGEQYWVNLDPNQLSGADSSAFQFRYGNDIDNTVPARSDLQILASAKGGSSTCTKTRPAIVRYEK